MGAVTPWSRSALHTYHPVVRFTGCELGTRDAGNQGPPHPTLGIIYI